MQHAVPLNEEAIARLSHSAMGLDVYTWLAQRLHRVDPKKAALVPWVSLKQQFGYDYGAYGGLPPRFCAHAQTGESGL